MVTCQGDEGKNMVVESDREKHIAGEGRRVKVCREGGKRKLMVHGRWKREARGGDRGKW